MGYTDAQGRPEWIAQPFIKKGTAASRVADVPRPATFGTEEAHERDVE